MIKRLSYRWKICVKSFGNGLCTTNNFFIFKSKLIWHNLLFFVERNYFFYPIPSVFYVSFVSFEIGMIMIFMTTCNRLRNDVSYDNSISNNWCSIIIWGSPSVLHLHQHLCIHLHLHQPRLVQEIKEWALMIPCGDGCLISSISMLFWFVLEPIKSMYLTSLGAQQFWFVLEKKKFMYARSLGAYQFWFELKQKKWCT